MSEAADTGISGDLVLSEVRRIKAHPLFASSDQLKRFLDFTVDLALAGRGAEIKEYTIAVSVLGRPADFDPGSASIVRTQAGNLRTRLKQYYATLTEAPPLQIVYRPGNYCPVLDRKSTRLNSSH